MTTAMVTATDTAVQAKTRMAGSLRRYRATFVELVIAFAMAVACALLLWGSSFAHNMVHDQLADQKISFPPQSTTVKGGALDPAEFPGLQQYAGQAVDSGPKAKAYANQFIAKHLEGVNGGKTYSQTSSDAIAARSAATAAKASNDPNFTTLDANATALEGKVQTLFRGETLRGLLLYAWGWSLVGSIAFYVGIAAAIGAALLLGLAAWGYFHVRHNGVNHS